MLVIWGNPPNGLPVDPAEKGLKGERADCLFVPGSLLPPADMESGACDQLKRRLKPVSDYELASYPDVCQGVHGFLRVRRLFNGPVSVLPDAGLFLWSGTLVMRFGDAGKRAKPCCAAARPLASRMKMAWCGWFFEIERPPRIIKGAGRVTVPNALLRGKKRMPVMMHMSLHNAGRNFRKSTSSQVRTSLPVMWLLSIEAMKMETGGPIHSRKPMVK